MLKQTTIRDASAIAEEAFVFAYPLVLMSRTRARATAVAVPDPDTLRAPINTLVLARDTPDTLRILGWLDLASEPFVLKLADTHGRYYVIWLRDAWNTVFATLGARTTGTVPRAFALLGPAGTGTRLQPGLTAIEAPTRAVRVTGCVEAIGENDEEACRRVRDDFRFLSSIHSRPACAPALPSGDPVEQVDRMRARAFFAEVARLVGDNPPDLATRAVLDRLRELGPWPSLAPDVRASLERGVERGRRAVRAEAERPPGESSGRWQLCLNPGDRLRRAGAARSGVHDNPASDALSALLDTDADGQSLTGDRGYVLRFAPDAPPPVQGFWSLTASSRTPGPAHSIGDLRGLVLDRDGSLPIHIQHRPPARSRRSNWLPVPPDGFGIELRLYWPSAEALERRWVPPPLTRVR